MERCVDCNSLLTREEKVCIECGTTVGGRSSGFNGFLASIVSICFYLSLVAMVGSLFTSRLPSFTFCMIMTAALLFVMRTTKDGVGIKKR